ncbi:MAG: hypothetical protein WKF42_07255 [Solirubrobacteraceae bacterium]
MGKRSRRPNNPKQRTALPAPTAGARPTPDPDRLLLDAIADGELDHSLHALADITVDAYDQDEALMGFENAFDEAACLPCPATVIGETIEILSVATTNGHQELIATCQRAGHSHQIALLDITVNAGQPAARLAAAYRRWIGAAT